MRGASHFLSSYSLSRTRSFVLFVEQDPLPACQMTTAVPLVATMSMELP